MYKHCYSNLCDYGTMYKQNNFNLPSESSHDLNRSFYSCLLSDLALDGSDAGVDLVLIHYTHCFCCVKQVVLVLTRCIYMTKVVRSVSKQG